MISAKGALASGLLVLLAAFAIGTENQLSTSVMGQTEDCGPSISASWPVSGTPDQAQPGWAATGDERRAAAACSRVMHESRVLIVTVMGMGCLLAVVGWTAVRARRQAEPRTVTPTRVYTGRESAESIRTCRLMVRGTADERARLSPLGPQVKRGRC